MKYKECIRNDSLQSMVEGFKFNSIHNTHLQYFSIQAIKPERKREEVIRDKLILN